MERIFAPASKHLAPPRSIMSLHLRKQAILRIFGFSYLNSWLLSVLIPGWLWQLNPCFAKLLSRPEVRKSASQTLFAPLTTHGNIFSISNWYRKWHAIPFRRKLSFRERLVWKILFPLQEKVESNTLNASTSSSSVANPGIIVHHSRNTAAKQWDETRALVLSGVTKARIRVWNLSPEFFTRCFAFSSKAASRWTTLMKLGKKCFNIFKPTRLITLRKLLWRLHWHFRLENVIDSFCFTKW